eukprot:TRINITY_DN2579_c1_g1_i1.p1 TRINITY_DN2579_c1_g1~~TRINITY_DN2579_c1_g1_i1.p1  ORF type:complete len:510 (-),score=137.55 TRINITY_DN2579_c1_g1_i1:86-1615(-)
MKKQKKNHFGSMNNIDVPLAVCTDSYKITHFYQYPEAKKMVAYGEFRSPFNKDKNDNRFVNYGIRYIIENYLLKQWTEEEVRKSKLFFSTHNSGFNDFPFPEEVFMEFVRNNNGYFPVKLQALQEGTCANIHVPVYQITAEGKYARLVTFLETILTHVWYPSTVATLSRRIKDKIQKAFKESVDDESHFLIGSRLHDFGFRGCTSLEQATLGGSSHLLNFDGSDTLSACYYVQFHLNGGKPIGTSIPATEHSVMTSWPSEKDAIKNMMNRFGGEGKVYACVLDSYDYKNCLEHVVPSLKELKVEKKGFMVYRPDSGDPIEAVLMGLAAGEKTFGFTKNKKGFKVLNGVGVIQGDGINDQNVNQILEAVHKNGYSAQNVAFGMGGGLLHKMNRDTMSFATKLSHITYQNGTHRDVMKKPKTDPTKYSLPGEVKVIRNEKGYPVVYPVEHPVEGENLLQTFYDNGPVKDLKWPLFYEIRERIEKEWHNLDPLFDPISPQLKLKMQNYKINI